MMTSYVEYQELVISAVDEMVRETCLSTATFLSCLESLHAAHDESARSLIEILSNLDSFVDFSKMMENQYGVLYSRTEAVFDATLQSKSQQLKSNASGDKPSGGPYVRVLWDIENVAVPKELGGMKTVSNLSDFLKSKGWSGSGIDTRVTAFFNPAQRSISEKVINELDKAGVELIWVSKKREDADRKLTMRISQEMQVLTPSITTFVIISSDQDFTRQMQLLQNAGFYVVIIHDAKTESWKSALEMHSSEAFPWSFVAAYVDVATSNSIISSQALENVSESQSRSGDQNTFDIKELSIGWIEGICIRWKNIYGFISIASSSFMEVISVHERLKLRQHEYFGNLPEEVRALIDGSSSDSKEVRVFVHYKSLDTDEFSCMNIDGELNSSDVSSSDKKSKKSSSAVCLHKGEKVRSLVVLGKRGFRALTVKKNHHICSE
jgi:hypothetical protein